jgi:hypothetical protein
MKGSAGARTVADGWSTVKVKWQPLKPTLEVPIADIRRWIDTEMERVWRPWPGFADGPRIGAGVGVYWWASTCDSVCHYLWADIAARWPELEPSVQHGYWQGKYHVWWVLADGSILDPTSQQFEMPHIALWRPWDSQRHDYDPSPIAAASCRPKALARGFSQQGITGRPTVVESSAEKAERVYEAAAQMLRQGHRPEEDPDARA